MPTTPATDHPAPLPPLRRPTSRRTLLAALPALFGSVLVGCARPLAASPPVPAESTPAPSPTDDTPPVVTYAAEAKPPQRVDVMALPLRLGIPRLGVDAPVIAVGLTGGFAMDVPQQPDQVGWYEYSSRPGMKGNAVLAGHLDWMGKPGVFRQLADVRPGDKVVVRGADGDAREYTVQWNKQWLMSAAPVGTIFEPVTDPALTLITCGGRWDARTQRYDMRVVVRATQERPTPGNRVSG